MLHILIYGIENPLGICCAARLLQAPDVRITYFPAASSPDQITDMVLSASLQISGEVGASASRPEIQDRCSPAGVDLHLSPLGCAGPVCADQAWYFKGAGSSSEDPTELDRLISLFPALGVTEFNYVAFDSNQDDFRLGLMDLWADFDEEEFPYSGIARQCQSQGIKLRIFRTSLIVGASGCSQEHDGGVLPGFLASLHSFKAELEERTPEYFDFHALRYLASADAVINVLPASVASELVLRISRNPSTANATFSIVSPKHTLFSAFCENISIACGLGLLLVEDSSELNAVDRAFQERTGQLQSYFQSCPEVPGIRAYLVAALSPEVGVFGEQVQLDQLESICGSLNVVRAERERRTADIPCALGKKTLTRDGSTITYYSGGAPGSTVVLVNALGQGLEFWHRLIDQLAAKHRVVIWEPRGTVSPSAFGLADQVSDLDAILRNEAIESCHLVGWCTGPKVIVEFYLRRPEAVQTVVFLNSTFKCEGSPEELDTPYEKNLEFLCRRLALKPAMAPSIMKAFQSPAAEDEADSLDSADREEIGVKVISKSSQKPRQWALAPFRNEETTLNYARQMVDFWSYDVRSKFSKIDAPVLLLSTEYDGVVTSDSSRMAAELLPDARHLHVPYATHYCLYDRPEFIAQLLHSFFQNPAGISAPKLADEPVALALR